VTPSTSYTLQSYMHLAQLNYSMTCDAGVTLLTRAAPLLSEQQANDLCFLVFRNLPVLINGCSQFITTSSLSSVLPSSSASCAAGPNLIPLIVTLLLNLFRRLRFASGLFLSFKNVFFVTHGCSSLPPEQGNRSLFFFAISPYLQLSDLSSLPFPLSSSSRS
jgi:hypothetical protein